MILLKLFWTFFKIGLFTIGGGYAMIPLIKSEVLAHGWLEMEQLVDFIAISESTPGPFAINIATFIGRMQGGVLGALVASIGVVLPSFICILIIVAFVNKLTNNRFFQAAMKGAKAVVIGLISAVALSMLYSNLLPSASLSDFSIASLVIMVVAFIMTRIKKVSHPILIILVAAVLGILFYGVIY